jgi:prophage regulatory protein
MESEITREAGIMREAEVRCVSGLSRTTRWRLQRLGMFPRPYQLSSRSIGWLRSEIIEWINSRQRTTGGLQNDK